jgi:hypothetical protein
MHPKRTCDSLTGSETLRWLECGLAVPGPHCALATGPAYTEDTHT